MDTHPVGAFGTPLAPNLSVAVDKNIYPLGLPFFIQMEKNESILCKNSDFFKKKKKKSIF